MLPSPFRLEGVRIQFRGGFARRGDRMKPSLKRIPVGSSSTSSMIDPRKRYRVRIEDRWYEGTFSKQWFGWNFEDYGSSGIQLNLIDEVFEIVPVHAKVRKGKS
jgi:hypothetical protein